MPAFRAAVDIEKSLTVQTDGQQVEEWLELANGCEYTSTSYFPEIVKIKIIIIIFRQTKASAAL